MKRKPVAKLTTERDGSTVRLIFACESEYAAMKLFDELTASAGEGSINLALNVGVVMDGAR